jgi:hypothetical protein
MKGVVIKVGLPDCEALDDENCREDGQRQHVYLDRSMSQLQT